MTTNRIFVSDDAAAVSVGADQVVLALQAEIDRRSLDMSIVRTGTRGLFWLEPLVEFETNEGRVGYGPVKACDVASILELRSRHPLYFGLVQELPYLKNQQRVTFARCGLINPLSLEQYETHGGLKGLRRALSMGSGDIVEEVVQSGLRGRGGAGFPTGIKWQTVNKAESDQKYVVCNADEGDSGTFADRMLMEGDPLLLIEGMVIAGLAVGANKGFIYLRSEYPDAFRKVTSALEAAKVGRLLGHDILGSGAEFEIEVRLGAGAYICGEETSLLESLEGRRGQIRPKPPLPALKGLFNRPTVINNVLSFAAIPTILSEGAAFYRDHGMGRSRGTMPIQLSGNVKRGGLIERGFGITLEEIVEDYGGGTFSGKPIRAIQVGGPLGAYWPKSMFDTPFDYEAFLEKGGMIGHGGVVVFDDTVDLSIQARFALEFCSIESCGKCTPCRIGSTRGVETIDKIIRGESIAENIGLVRDLCEVMRDGSLCALGGLTPVPVLSALEHFPDDFVRV